MPFLALVSALQQAFASLHSSVTSFRLTLRLFSWSSFVPTKIKQASYDAYYLTCLRISLSLLKLLWSSMAYTMKTAQAPLQNDFVMEWQVYCPALSQEIRYSIPYLHLHIRIADFYGLCAKLDADGCLVVMLELALYEVEGQGCFSCALMTHDDDFESYVFKTHLFIKYHDFGKESRITVVISQSSSQENSYQHCQNLGILTIAIMKLSQNIVQFQMILLVVSSAKSKYIKMNSEDLAIRDELNTKKIVYEVRYSDAYILLYHRNRIVEDSRKLHRAYTTMYPTKVDIDPYGTNSLLVLQGHIQVMYNVTNSLVMLMFKVYFPKEYPKVRPVITVQNPNENAHECNSLYLMSGLAKYQQSPIDKKFHLFMDVPKLKEWSPKSDLLSIVNQIVARLNENFPFVRKQVAFQTTLARSNERSDMHPSLKAELDKAEQDMAEMVSEFDILRMQKKEAIFNSAYHQVVGDQLQRKLNQLSKNVHVIAEVIDQASAVDLSIKTVDAMLEYEGKSAKVLQLASQRDALDESHQFLRQQLKKGVSMNVLSKHFKILYEQMFDNQLAINQLQ